MKIGLITLFPKAVEPIQFKDHFGLVGKAFEEGKAELFIEDLRTHGIGKHKVVDDSPYGGGDGMVLKPEPIQSALESVLTKMGLGRDEVKSLYTCPSGELWSQKKAESWTKPGEDGGPPLKGVVILCGRYAGADIRAVEKLFDEKISMGPFVLNGGELPALCIVETLVRLLPGVLGNPDSVKMDSFSGGEFLIEAEPYTKPQIWEGMEVPKVLLSGNHKEIKGYKAKRSQEKTKDWVKRAKVVVGGENKEAILI